MRNFKITLLGAIVLVLLIACKSNVLNRAGNKNIPYGLIDSSRYTITYNISKTLDSKLLYKIPLLLKIGDKYSVTYSKDKFRNDSLLQTSSGEDVFRMQLYQALSKDNFSLDNQTLFNRYKKYTYKDYSNNRIMEIDEISSTQFCYYDYPKKINWKLKNGEKKILGFVCRRADCKFRGRNYIAWFTEEIPLSEGPWKFRGLPGLILEITDTDRVYNFKAIGFKEIKSPIVFLKSINKSKKYIKISRKDFVRDKRNGNSKWNILSEDSNSIRKKRIKKGINTFIEKDEL
ncbi:GLPGLI family protein [Marinilabiliaceae bacterium JC040]|nr:GLPGLI family protein [Marinilabiliaceae bacterium JC040]